MTCDGALLFALDGSRSLAENVGRRLGMPLAAHAETEFADGECKCRALVDVRGKDVFVLHSLFRDAGRSQHDKLVRLLLLLGALADGAPASLTAVVPYLCYARQERRMERGDPVATRYVAEMFEAVGTTRVLSVDVHDVAAFCNAFRCRTHHVEAAALFAAHFAARVGDAQAVVVSPDAGGVTRAERFRRALSAALDRPVEIAFIEKHRGDSGLAGTAAFGPFADRTAIIVDDMICTGATALRAAQACRRFGARRVYVAATHAALAGDVAHALADAAIDGVVLTDTIPTPPLDFRDAEDKLVVLDASAPIAEAIAQIRDGGDG